MVSVHVPFLKKLLLILYDTVTKAAVFVSSSLYFNT